MIKNILLLNKLIPLRMYVVLFSLIITSISFLFLAKPASAFVYLYGRVYITDNNTKLGLNDVDFRFNQDIAAFSCPNVIDVKSEASVGPPPPPAPAGACWGIKAYRHNGENPVEASKCFSELQPNDPAIESSFLTSQSHGWYHSTISLDASIKGFECTTLMCGRSPDSKNNVIVSIKNQPPPGLTGDKARGKYIVRNFRATLNNGGAESLSSELLNAQTEIITSASTGYTDLYRSSIPFNVNFVATVAYVEWVPETPTVTPSPTSVPACNADCSLTNDSCAGGGQGCVCVIPSGASAGKCTKGACPTGTAYDPATKECKPPAVTAACVLENGTGTITISWSGFPAATAPTAVFTVASTGAIGRNVVKVGETSFSQILFPPGTQFTNIEFYPNGWFGVTNPVPYPAVPSTVTCPKLPPPACGADCTNKPVDFCGDTKDASGNDCNSCLTDPSNPAKKLCTPPPACGGDCTNKPTDFCGDTKDTSGNSCNSCLTDPANPNKKICTPPPSCGDNCTNKPTDFCDGLKIAGGTSCASCQTDPTTGTKKCSPPPACNSVCDTRDPSACTDPKFPGNSCNVCVPNSPGSTAGTCKANYCNAPCDPTNPNTCQKGVANNCGSCRPTTTGYKCQDVPACGDGCASNKDCNGAKDGCTACIGGDTTPTAKTCKPFDQGLCECKASDPVQNSGINAGQNSTFTAYAYIQQKGIGAAEVKTIQFSLYQCPNKDISKGCSIMKDPANGNKLIQQDVPAQLVENTATTVRYKATWRVKIPANLSAANLYRVQTSLKTIGTDKGCQQISDADIRGLSTSRVEVTSVESESDSNMFESFINFFTGFFGGNKSVLGTNKTLLLEPFYPAKNIIRGCSNVSFEINK